MGGWVGRLYIKKLVKVTTGAEGLIPTKFNINVTSYKDMFPKRKIVERTRAPPRASLAIRNNGGARDL